MCKGGQQGRKQGRGSQQDECNSIIKAKSEALCVSCVLCRFIWASFDGVIFIIQNEFPLYHLMIPNQI